MSFPNNTHLIACILCLRNLESIVPACNGFTVDIKSTKVIRLGIAYETLHEKPSGLQVV